MNSFVFGAKLLAGKVSKPSDRDVLFRGARHTLEGGICRTMVSISYSTLLFKKPNTTKYLAVHKFEVSKS